MATAEIGALRVVLALNAGEYSRGLQKASRDTKDFGSSISRLSDQMESASYEFNSGIMAAQRFANVVSSIVNVAREFGSGMSAVSTLVDTNTESMKAMSEAVLAIGRRTPVALTDLTTGLYDLRSAGTTAEDAMERLERSAQLGVAGLGTTKEAVDLVTSSINAFGLTGKDADDVYNNIFKTIQAGKTTISGLAQGFGAVASTVSAAGVSLKEYLASIAALTVTGLPAAVAHTQIRAAIAGMTRESELATKVLNAMGVKTFKELIEKSGGMVAAFKNITTALGGNDAAMIKLFGSVEAYNAVLSLTGKQNAAFTANMLKMNDGLDAVQEGFQKRNEGLGASLDKMRNAFQELGIALGEALLPAIQSISAAVVGLTTWFKSLSPEVQSAITSITLIAAVIAPAVAAIGFFINALGAVVGVVATVGAAIMGLLVASGPIGLFVIVASAAVTAWNIFRDDIIAIWNAVASTIVAKVQEIMAWMQRLGTFVSEVFSSIMSGDFDAAMERMGKGMGDQFSAIEQHLEGVSVMMDVIKTKNEEAAANAFTYKGPIIAATDAESESLKNRNSIYREGLQLFNETLTPMEQLIFKQMQINSLFQQGAIDATTYGRAMAQASAFSAKNMDALASSVSSNLSAIFGESKGVAIATAIINTAQGVTRALAQYPPPISFAMAAIQAAAGAAQIAKIKSMTKSGSGGGGSGGGGGGGGGATAGASQVPQMLTVRGLDPNTLMTGASVRELADKLLAYQRDGGQVVIQ
jgi:TP901 family phage tail tape measure protein